MIINEGIKTSFKAVMNQVFTIVGLIVELITTISKPQGSIEAFI